jgi:hypothetical protein
MSAMTINSMTVTIPGGSRLVNLFIPLEDLLKIPNYYSFLDTLDSEELSASNKSDKTLYVKYLNKYFPIENRPVDIIMDGQIMEDRHVPISEYVRFMDYNKVQTANPKDIVASYRLMMGPVFHVYYPATEGKEFSIVGKVKKWFSK